MPEPRLPLPEGALSEGAVDVDVVLGAYSPTLLQARRALLHALARTSLEPPVVERLRRRVVRMTGCAF